MPAIEEVEGETCAGCRYFQPGHDSPSVDRGQGLCRRYPEHVHTDPVDWCGEFARDPLKADLLFPGPIPWRDDD